MACQQRYCLGTPVCYTYNSSPVEILRIDAQVVVDALTFNPKLQSLVQGQEYGVNQMQLAREYALAEKLRVEYWQRAIQALHNIEQVPQAVFSVRQPKRGHQRARSVEVSVVSKQLIARPYHKVSISQPG